MAKWDEKRTNKILRYYCPYVQRPRGWGERSISEFCALLPG